MTDTPDQEDRTVRMGHAVKLASFGVPDHMVDAICKIAAQGTLTMNTFDQLTQSVDISGYLDARRIQALEQRDQELGRWRSKEHPEVVVYPLGSHPNALDMVNELTSTRHRCWEDCRDHGYKWGEVKDEYFAAHPEKKPWHDAEPGEVWLLDIDGKADPEPALVTRASIFETPKALRDLEDPAIFGGRRLWPEPEEDQ